jgi:putative aldouronate transport system permease protein
LYVLFAAPFLFYVLFEYAPMFGVLIAFKDIKVFRGLGAILSAPGVGFKYFELYLTDPYFWKLVRNTVVIQVLVLAVGFPAPIILALLLDQVRRPGFKRVSQTVSYLPHFLSWVVLAGLFKQFLSPTMGPIGMLLGTLGIKAPFFLGDPAWFPFALVVTGIWKEVGWGTIIYLAHIASIDPELYSAASVDGASRLRMARHITLPSLAPVISILLILRLGDLLDAGFDQIFNLYNEAVYRTGDILDTYVYRQGLVNFKYSFATAAGLFKNVIGFALVVGANRIVKLLGQTPIW